MSKRNLVEGTVTLVEAYAKGGKKNAKRRNAADAFTVIDLYVRG